MAKQRKVGNLLALALLSAAFQRPMHPYEMASVLRARGKDQDMTIKWGSLYTVVRNLVKHGLLEAALSTRQGGRPERTVYEITAEGRAELEDWIRELVAVPEAEHPHFAAGLSELQVLSPQEATGLLELRLLRLNAEVAADRARLDADATEVPRLFLIESEYQLALREAEAAWVTSLLRELADGSLPGMAEWQSFHRTGQIPPELLELAELGGAEIPAE
ncbi:PadR family transcriptional regulator [Streptacidiphilus anmyonensis]|uniref:PadR family transcriptional regulator n=1 Tax=Streptacidiphilus anmyonensis TaxID=405782 RepID=UPI0005A7CC24|nr:PadR family transcriptional regulator [Streptacidiphilus anmyonensis]